MIADAGQVIQIVSLEHLAGFLRKWQQDTAAASSVSALLVSPGNHTGPQTCGEHALVRNVSQHDSQL